MRKVWVIIRREFSTRVRTRAFVFSTVLLPVLIAGMTLLPMLLAQRETAPRRVAVLQETSQEFGRRVVEVLNDQRRPNGRQYYVAVEVPAVARLEALRDSLVARVGLVTDGLDGVLIVTDSSIASGHLVYFGGDVGSPTDMRRLETLLQPIVQIERLRRAGVTLEVARAELQPIVLATTKVSQGQITTESGDASFLLAYLMSFVLYFALLIYGVQVMSSIVEEKSTRIIEILVSSLSPFEMMLGKVLGVGATGLLQLAIWAGTATALTSYHVQIAKLLDTPPVAMPSLPTMSPPLLVIFLLFFILGFLLYAALYAAVGAMCSSTQETQQAQLPVTMCIVAGIFVMFAVIGEPNGSLARTLSLVPFVAPFVVPVRYSVTPLTLGELLPPIAMMLLGIAAVTWLGARIYRVGVLMYGKRPTFMELARWIRMG